MSSRTLAETYYPWPRAYWRARYFLQQSLPKLGPWAIYTLGDGSHLIASRPVLHSEL